MPGYRQSFVYTRDPYLGITVAADASAYESVRPSAVTAGLFTMMTSSNGNIFRVAGPLCGEFTGPGEFPTQRPVTRRIDVFFDLRLNNRLSKQPWSWWFETLLWSLWRQCNVMCFISTSNILRDRVSVMDRMRSFYNMRATSHERHGVSHHRPLDCLFSSLC